MLLVAVAGHLTLWVVQEEVTQARDGVQRTRSRVGVATIPHAELLDVRRTLTAAMTQTFVER